MPTRTHDVRILFPSWGAKATVTAVMADGRSVKLGSRPLPLTGVAYFFIASRDSGYVVVPGSRRLPGQALLLHPAAQAGAPLAGPSSRSS